MVYLPANRTPEEHAKIVQGGYRHGVITLGETLAEIAKCVLLVEQSAEAKRDNEPDNDLAPSGDEAALVFWETHVKI